MCHWVELAVLSVIHAESMLDKLYSISSTSPKAQRALESSAAQLGVVLRKIGKVLGCEVGGFPL